MLQQDSEVPHRIAVVVQHLAADRSRRRHHDDDLLVEFQLVVAEVAHAFSEEREVHSFGRQARDDEPALVVGLGLRSHKRGPSRSRRIDDRQDHHAGERRPLVVLNDSLRRVPLGQ